MSKVLVPWWCLELGYVGVIGPERAAVRSGGRYGVLLSLLAPLNATP